MKKFLSVFMSIVMIVGVTTSTSITSFAAGWASETKKIEFNSTYTEMGMESDYCALAPNSSYEYIYYDSFLFYVPVKSNIKLHVESAERNYFSFSAGNGNQTKFIIYKYSDVNNRVTELRPSENFNSARGVYYSDFSFLLEKGKYYLVAEYRYPSQFNDYYSFNMKLNPNISTPSTLKVSSSSYSGFTVNWSRVANVDGYLIKYATKSDFSNAAIAKVENGNTTSKTITGRASNTKYYVKVQAYKKVNGTTYKSNWSEIKTVKTLEKKAAITSITPIAKGFTVKWDKVNGKLGYQIRYATKSNFSNAAIIYAGNGNTTSKTVTGRAARTKYYVQVRSYVKVNGQYKYDAWSPAKTVTTK